MRGYNYNNIPTHKHDCMACKFLFGVVFYDDHEKVGTVDVYKQCGHEETVYLLRYSSEPSEYYSSVSMEQLVAGFSESRGIIKEKK